MTRPIQKSPKLDDCAHAPYNFVSLPEFALPFGSVEFEDKNPEHYDLPKHSMWQTGPFCRSGFLDVTLTTRSWTFTRGPLTRVEFDRDGQGQYIDDGTAINKVAPDYGRLGRNVPFFCYRDKVTKRPFIPGSSLRGAIRTIFEIITYAKFQQFEDKQLFFRTFDGSSLSTHYRYVLPSRKIRAGFLYRQGDRYRIRPCPELVPGCRNYAIVPKRMIETDLGLDTHLSVGERQVPNWELQGRKVWCRVRQVRAGNRAHRPAYPEPAYLEVVPESLRFWDNDKATSSEEVCGRLVISGQVDRKRYEFIFFESADSTGNVVDHSVIDRFHSAEQITAWQKEAFPQDKPTRDYRDQPGYLTTKADPMEPVFYHEDGTFLGRAEHFRVAYAQSIKKLVPECIQRVMSRTGRPLVDYAEATFGYIGSEYEPPAYRGRVTFSDALLPSGAEDKSDWCDGKKAWKLLLGSPQETCVQHYLVQKASWSTKSDAAERIKENKRKLKHYGSDPQHTELRGTKLYWHQHTPPRDDGDGVFNAMQTQLLPVPKDTQFQFRVYFDNLSDFELGALCWALQPVYMQQDAAGNPVLLHHKIGMAKPLGFGSVELTPSLTLIDRTNRYKQLFGEPVAPDGRRHWHSGQSESAREPSTVADFATLFDERMAEILNDREAHRVSTSGQQGPLSLQQFRRIAQLLRIMRFPSGRIDATYMPRPEEFRDRKVLPDALEY